MNTKKAGLTIAGILAVAIPLRAQSQRFEVASVRRAEIPANGRGVPVFPTIGGVDSSDPSRITYHGTWLTSLIQEAFDVRPYQINGPNWLNAERYDIVANIPKGATKAEFKIMLGNLLRDRFNLRFHMDSKPLPVYVLHVAKNGTRLREATHAPGTDNAAAPSVPVGGRDAQGFLVVPAGFQGSRALPIDGEIFVTAQDAPLVELTRLIETKVGRPIIDETGLASHYDFKIHMEWIGRPAGAGDAPSGAPSVFTAVEEQLGLKLESASRPIPQFVIDSIDRAPTEN